jgi:hypothetical protein
MQEDIIMRRYKHITAHYYLRIKELFETVGTIKVVSLLSVFGTSPAIAETVDCS